MEYVVLGLSFKSTHESVEHAVTWIVYGRGVFHVIIEGLFAGWHKLIVFYLGVIVGCSLGICLSVRGALLVICWLKGHSA